MMLGKSIFQDRTDELVKKTLEEIRRASYTEDDKLPQPYDRETIRQFLLYIIEESKTFDVPVAEIEKRYNSLKQDIEELYNMCKGDQNYYLEQLDIKRKREANIKNDKTIFTLCLSSELSNIVGTPQEIDNYKYGRLQQFYNGIKVYDESLLVAAKATQIQLDQQMPGPLKKLIDVSLLDKSADILKSLNINKGIKF